MTNVTIALPASIMLRTVGGKAISLDCGKLSPEVVARIFESGAKVILTNAFNGGGKDLAESAKLAQMQKRMDAWYRGEFIVVERGDSVSGAMREAYLDEVRAATGATVKAVEAAMKAQVESVLGKDANATFANFMVALATTIARRDDAKASPEAIEAVRAKIEAKYLAAVEAKAAANAKVTAKLDLTDISF